MSAKQSASVTDGIRAVAEMPTCGSGWARSQLRQACDNQSVCEARLA